MLMMLVVLATLHWYIFLPVCLTCFFLHVNKIEMVAVTQLENICGSHLSSKVDSALFPGEAFGLARTLVGRWLRKEGIIE